MKMKKGKVYLIGAGPGDPGLLTLKGKACIESADVVIYDYLAARDLLRHAAKDAEKIYVGKKGGDHTLSQDGINDLIVQKASAGMIVARLKGGDPFIFGRGGEEAEILIDKQIPFEIIPGVTSAIAAPAYAGIPLTHRKYTSSVAFVTGHEDPAKKKSTVNWEALAKGVGTIVFLMGVKNLSNIVAQLLRHGRPSDTPVALVRWGTTSRQQTVSGTLDTIVDEVASAGLTSPSIIVVGGVAELREKMRWFEKKPLFGKKIVVTRARKQASVFVDMLSNLGAYCIESPTIEVVGETDTKPLDSAIDDISSYEWIVFTSVNGVEYFFKRLFEKSKDTRALGHLKTATIGPATEKRLLDFGITSDIVPESYRAESIIDAFKTQDVVQKRILLPRARDARPILPVELKKMGALVDEIICYTSLPVAESSAALIEKLEHNDVDMITFTSSSTVKNFHKLLPTKNHAAILKNIVIASIGPVTTETAEKLGFTVHVTADTYTIPGLCDAILKYYQNNM